MINPFKALAEYLTSDAVETAHSRGFYEGSKITKANSPN